MKYLSDYEIAKAKKEIFDKYKNQLDEYLKRESEIDALELIEISEDDDMSSNFAIKELEERENLLKEYSCPCCGHGLRIERGKIVKGTISSQEERKEINEEIDTLIKEISNRKLIEQFRIDFANFTITDEEEPVFPEKPKLHEIPTNEDPINPQTILQTFTLPSYSYEEAVSLNKSLSLLPLFKEYSEISQTECPEYPELKQLSQLDKPKVFTHPGLTSFKVPFYDYQMTKSLYDSLSKIDQYNKWNENDYSHIDYSDDEKTYVENQINEYKSLSVKLKEHENFIAENEDVYEITDEEIKEFEEEINELVKKVEIGNVALIYQEHKSKFLNLKEEQEESAEKQVCIDQLMFFIKDIENSSIENMIESINESLKVICNDLFDSPISITLQTTKILKNKKEKNDVNLLIVFNGLTYNSPNELSGGEKHRVSFALLLALMVVNISPICIMDEVLPSMENDLKTRALDTMNKFAGNKFIIHICHDICKGQHDHIIDMTGDEEEIEEENI